MNQENRVLSRRNARELTVDEIGHVSGAVYTEAPCSFDPKTGQLDGPILDCPR